MNWQENRLTSVRVVDLTQVVSGSVTTMMFADYGSDVIKVEPPGGEPYRRFGTPVPGTHGTENLNAMRFNRNKRSIGLDLKSETGHSVLTDLIRSSDVVIENFRPGVFAKLGFDFDALKELNPNIVYTTVSGYGHEDLLPSPHTYDPAYAILAEASAGLLGLAGEPDGPPVWMGFAMSDIFSGVLAFTGTLLALQEVDAGRGPQRVDISMFDASMFMNDLAVNAFSVLGRNTTRGQYPLQAPWGPFPAADGYIAIALMSEREWANLCQCITKPEMVDDPRFSTGELRAEHMELIDAAVSGWLSSRSVREAVAALTAAGVPCAPVNDSAGVVSHPHVAARKMLVEVDHAYVGTHRIVGNPIKTTVADRLSEVNRLARLGEDSVEILTSVLGYSQESVEEMIRSGSVIRAT